MKTIGFIGVGNMGGAMAKACSKVEGGQVWVFDVNSNLYKQFDQDEAIQCATDIEMIMAHCDYIVMSVKPQYYAEVAEKIKVSIKENQVVVTVAPSFSLDQMKNLLGEKVKIIRTMPNTPALISEGITAYCYNINEIKQELVTGFEKYFGSFGELIKVDEKLMPAVVATTGSSPAYVYLFIEAMADAAVSFGMPRAMAYQMSATALKGAAAMVLETGKHPGELKDAVTSPGGTTIKAILAMEENGFRNSIIKGMEACHSQVKDMSKKM